ncbi:polyprenyl synthetase family protein [Streptomyces marispadix]|uniref:Polyprenyl synthetase family protein n=1 Tax=Streptomyces marispadix TaxID=2922868 RepID=A0ABS9SX68_9ACTN|nr:polyprenyl synthetase family protein [Streptomyces marispadix]MCH6160875.1 polyprenyl synthetase family protein [Streptomyces marispadix]
MLDGQDYPEISAPPAGPVEPGGLTGSHGGPPLDRPGSDGTGTDHAGLGAAAHTVPETETANAARTTKTTTGTTDGTTTGTTDGAGTATATATRTGAREAARRSLEDWLTARDGDPLTEQHRWALLPPGKLLRPVLLLESAAAVGGRTEQVEPAATGFELMHAGSLIHDDIIDGDEIRRGRAANHCRYGVERAVVSADALFFAVFETLGECRRRGVSDRLISDATAVIAEAGLDITRGATMELDLSGTLHDDTESYLEMARLKTAALLRAACRTGAVLAGATAEQADALTEFGETLGIAFQIQDDLLPYARPPQKTGGGARTAAGGRTEAEATGAGGGAGAGVGPGVRSAVAAGASGRSVTAGKSRTSDLRNGRPVLPLLLANRYGSDADRALLAELLDAGTDEELRQERLHRLLESTGALSAAQHTADTYLDRCRKALEVLPPSPHRHRLAALADQFNSRGVEAR